MRNCEMCGKEEDELTKITVSGAELETCSDCSKFGDNVEEEGNTDDEESSDSTSSSNQTGENQSTQDNQRAQPSQLVKGYGQVVREGRNSAGYSQAELANLIDEKESVIRRVEQEEMQPDNTLQTRLEDILGIQLSDSSRFGNSRGGMSLDPSEYSSR